MYRIRSVSLFCAAVCLLSSILLTSGTTKPGKLNHIISDSGIITSQPFIQVPATVPLIPAKTEAEIIYDSLQLNKWGLSQEAFIYAWKGYTNLKVKGRLSKSNVLSICDFSQSSRKKRLYVIDINTGKMILNTYVAHGKNSGAEYARYFSNKPESNQSSLGFYITSNTYFGGHGLSLQLKGIEKGINDKALARRIVIHGSDYVSDNYIKKHKYSGRSFGCPAVPLNHSKLLIQTIKNGSCLFIYHPSKKYLENSKILNG